jgi:hypothetical protein
MLLLLLSRRLLTCLHLQECFPSVFLFFSFFVLLLESDVVVGTADFNVLLLESFCSWTRKLRVVLLLLLLSLLLLVLIAHVPLLIFATAS